MTTLNTMVKRVAGLAGTKALTEWEESFVASISAQTRNGDDTRSLSDNQIEILERIFDKHFAG